MKETVNGIKHRGNWAEVVEVGETASKVVNDDDFEEWRPKDDEDYDEVKEKTAEKASTDGNSVLEKVELVVYRSIMLKTTPQYYDSDEVNANIEKKDGMFSEDTDYVIEVNTNDPLTREELRSKTQ